MPHHNAAARSPSPRMEDSSLPSIMDTARSCTSLPMYSSRVEGTGPYNSKGLSKVGQKQYTLDFSFMNLRHPMEAADYEPRKGTIAKKKGLSPVDVLVKTEQSVKEGAQQQQQGQQDDEPDMQNIMTFSENNTGKTQVTDDGFVVMRAKEETYAFKENKMDKILSNDKDLKRFELDENGNLVEKTDYVEDLANGSAARSNVKYRCTSLRLDNNKFVGNALGSLGAFFTKLLHKPEINLIHLDLSCNGIEVLPTSFGGAPLHTVLLHQNKINTIKEITKLQCLHATLKKLTLNGNPLQEKEKKRYKFKVLFYLPFVTNFDDSRITPKDRDALKTFESIFVPKEKRGTTKKFALPPITPSPGVSPVPR